MRFQSKYRTHKLLMRTTRRFTEPGAVTPTIVPGITVEFTGPQRTFDSEKQGWDDKTREEVEDWLLKHPKYGNGFYLAAGQALPPEKLDIARVKPKDLKRKCQAVSINEDTSEIEQCSKEPGVGKIYCTEHDPDEVKISRGLSTTT